MGEFGIGQPVRRFEDRRLLSGLGRFQNDNNLLGQAHAYVLRSPHAHARIRSLDPCAGAGRARRARVITDRRRPRRGQARRHGRAVPAQAARRLADVRPRRIRAWRKGRVRYVGEPVAFVVAETLAQAKDAAELDRRSITRRCPRSPTPPTRPKARSRSGTNAPTTSRTCSRPATRPRPTPPSPAPRISSSGATSSAASTRNSWSRAARSACRTRATSASRSTPTCNTRTACAQALATRIFKIPESRIRVIAGDVGGGFGTKGWQYPEHRLVLLGRAEAAAGRSNGAASAARRCSPTSTPATTSREAELALDKDGKFLGPARHARSANVGAYLSSERNLLRDLRQSRRAGRRLRHSGGACRASTRLWPTPTAPRPIAAPAGPRRPMSSSG